MPLPRVTDEGLERRAVPLKAYRLICEKRFDAMNQQQYCGVEGKRASPFLVDFLPVPEVERQYDEAFRELMRRLEKPERKMVLRLLDTRGLLAENAAFDSFACGFRLALELTTESQQHKKERSEEALAVLCATEEGQNEN